VVFFQMAIRPALPVPETLGAASWAIPGDDQKPTKAITVNTGKSIRRENLISFFLRL
jgi:hypothetical protein